MAQILEMMEMGRVSPAARKLVGGLPFAGAFSMGKIARAMLSPLYIRSNSDVASKAPAPSAAMAPVWWYCALSVRGPRVARPVSFSPDFGLSSDAEGFGGVRSVRLFGSPKGKRSASSEDSGSPKRLRSREGNKSHFCTRAVRSIHGSMDARQ